jgi:hypothetical protein
MTDIAREEWTRLRAALIRWVHDHVGRRYDAQPTDPPDGPQDRSIEESSGDRRWLLMC